MSRAQILAVIMMFMSLWLFALMGIDKHRAQNRQWRIPEARLFLYAILGGAIGGWLGMRVFRHKTKHIQFEIGFPLIAVLHLIALWCLL